MAARKIGILTLQNQLNYGGVLQAFALQRVLRDKGYDAEVVDYWLAPRNARLNGYFFDPSRSWLRRMTRAAGFLLKRGAYYVRSDIARHRRTIRFIKENIALSAVAYRSAKELEGITGYAALVVGSDQVWHYGFHGKPNPFLLGQVDASIRRVAYAASFGFTALPDAFLREYQDGIGRFAAIGVREKEGVALVKQWTGREAHWVLDPTLLLSERAWRQQLGPRPEGGPFTVCYWLGDTGKCAELVKALARRRETVHLYVELQHLYGQKGLRGWLFRRRLFRMPHVKVCCGAGPQEFLTDLAHAAAVVSDSFHALQFSCLFRKPVKIFINSSAQRAGMAARMKDFAERYGIGGVLEEDVTGQAFEPATPDYAAVWREIENDRCRSLGFLEDALRLL